MNTLSPESVVERLKWRCAVKKFDPTKKITDAQWAALEESLVLAPSSFGLQPWKFVVVTNPQVKAELVKHSWDQSQVRDCSHLVALAVKEGVGPADAEKLVDRIAAVTGAPRDKLEGYRQMMLGFFQQTAGRMDVDAWSTRQVYIALGFLMETAAVMGIDACPLEGISPPDYNRILKLAGTGYSTVCACAIGHRASDDPYSARKKVRYPTSELVVHVR